MKTQNKMKLTGLILALVMMVSLVGMFSLTASAAEVASGTTGDVNWSFDDATGTLTISGTGAMQDWGSGNNVPWYDFCSSIKTIVIENGVTSIGDYAFNYCPSVTSVDIPDSVTSIGNCAFIYCTSLTSVNIPDSVESIGEGAFYGCSALTSVTIGKSIGSIGVNAFHNCIDLETVNVSCNWNGQYEFRDGVKVNVPAHIPAEDTAYTDNGDGKHSYTCSVCGGNGTEAHTLVYSENGCHHHRVLLRKLRP